MMDLTLTSSDHILAQGIKFWTSVVEDHQIEELDQCYQVITALREFLTTLNCTVYKETEDSMENEDGENVQTFPLSVKKNDDQEDDKTDLEESVKPVVMKEVDSRGQHEEVAKERPTQKKKSVVCHQCPRSFISQKFLENHAKKNHGFNLTALFCHLCGKSFKDKYTLKNHITAVHEKSPSAKALCVDCGKTFSSKHALQVHHERFHSDLSFKCPKCDTEKKNTASLRRHMRNHHTSLERVKCTQCDKSFRQKIKLRKHISDVHDRLKPFYCEECQFQCARLDNLNLHRRKSHNRLDKKNKALLISMVENDQHPFYIT